MTQVIRYKEIIAETEFQLKQITANVESLAQQYGLDPLVVIEQALSDDELDKYLFLQARYERLKRWEAVDNERTD